MNEINFTGTEQTLTDLKYTVITEKQKQSKYHRSKRNIHIMRTLCTFSMTKFKTFKMEIC